MGADVAALRHMVQHFDCFHCAFDGLIQVQRINAGEHGCGQDIQLAHALPTER